MSILTEADTCRRYVLPKLYAAGWTDDQISEQKSFTDGRIVVAGSKVKRLPQKRLDYLLRYRRDFPIAVVEAKTLYAKPGDGLQQAKEYAQILGLGAFQLSLDFAQRWEHNPRRSSSPCSEVARTGTHDFKFRCRYPATFPRRSRHTSNEAIRARSFVLCTGQREGAGDLRDPG